MILHGRGSPYERILPNRDRKYVGYVLLSSEPCGLNINELLVNVIGIVFEYENKQRVIVCSILFSLEIFIKN
jgi:hypothetical protein